MPNSSEPDSMPPTGLRRLSKLNLGLLALSLVSMAAALYLSPVGQNAQDTVKSKVLDLDGPPAAAAAPPATTPSASADPAKAAYTTSASPSATSAASASSSSSTSSSSATSSSTTSTNTTKSSQGAKASQSSAARTVTYHCYDFTYQQDAQAVYLENLSDPYGLDGDPGPNNGDGIACTGLPDKPGVAASTPVDAYAPPTPSAKTKAELVDADSDYFGVEQNGVPGDTSALDKLSTQIGKTPSSVGWFSTFDDDYRDDLVTKSWNRGMLPVITWQPTDGEDSGNSYSLTSIINGDWDSYLIRYASDVKAAKLPVVLRLMHEMNGNWYSWSAGATKWNNSPEKFIEAWRHIWNVFDEVGANDDVIWLWSGSRVDNLTEGSSGITAMQDDYPGNKYVDWMGATVYLRNTSVGPTYDATFKKTEDELESITDPDTRAKSDKPIFYGEIGANQEATDGGDATDVKAAWTTNVLKHFAADDRVVGFLWFNNNKVAEVDGSKVDTDWRFNSNDTTLASFSAAVKDDQYAAGLALDGS